MEFVIKIVVGSAFVIALVLYVYEVIVNSCESQHGWKLKPYTLTRGFICVACLVIFMLGMLYLARIGEFN